jgi:peroxiredoxin Q/BCP
VIVGMSNDDVASHDAWIAKLGIPFQLVADTEHVALEAYGVWGEKEWDGKRYMGINRTTFLVRPDGVIARVWESVKPAGHAEEVLAALRESKGGG